MIIDTKKRIGETKDGRKFSVGAVSLHNTEIILRIGNDSKAVSYETEKEIWLNGIKRVSNGILISCGYEKCSAAICE